MTILSKKLRVKISDFQNLDSSQAELHVMKK